MASLARIRQEHRGHTRIHARPRRKRVHAQKPRYDMSSPAATSTDGLVSAKDMDVESGPLERTQPAAGAGGIAKGGARSTPLENFII